MRKITHLVVHCSATTNDPKYTLETIKRWHTDPKPKGNGWSDIGYHYVIEFDGTVRVGRFLETPGAHVAGYNATTIGICMIGGVDKNGKPENNFNDAQWKSLKGLLSQLKDLFPDADICGHRDFPKVNKACPSFDVRAWVKANLSTSK